MVISASGPSLARRHDLPRSKADPLAPPPNQPLLSPQVADSQAQGAIAKPMTGVIRATLVLTGFLLLTLPLMPLQWLLIKAGSRRQRRLPHWYHRQVCRLLGIRIHQKGEIRDKFAVLVISNHVTWLDVPVLSAVAAVSFVAKKEIASWPLAGSLARLQRTVFVDRRRRSAVGATSNEIAARLRAGDHVVLFAEGTSSDGNRVLPFKTSLFAAAKPGRPHARRAGTLPDEQAGPGVAPANSDDDAKTQVFVQTVALTYTSIHGLPLTRLSRPVVAWYGDMEMISHVWTLLKAGPIDIHVEVGAAVPLDDFADRKALACFAEEEIRGRVLRMLRGRSSDASDAPAKTTRPAKSWSQRDLMRSNVEDSRSNVEDSANWP